MVAGRAMAPGARVPRGRLAHLLVVGVVALIVSCAAATDSRSRTAAAATGLEKLSEAGKSQAAQQSAAPVSPLHSWSWQELLNGLLHLDRTLAHIASTHGRATYAIMFAVVFAETGLVALVFLPGDSLLVAAGVLASHGILQIMIAILVVFTAAVLGDAVNFYVGRHFGTKAVRSALVKREHVARTEWYFERYGGKTVVLARFIPVVRTVAPFVAGVASMPYRDFGIYNVVGAALWAAVCVGGGYLFGGLPFFREHYGLIMFALVAVSLAPLVVHAVRARHGGHRRNQLRLTGPGLLHPGTGVFSPNWRSQDKV